jgi:hypothetical protein
MFAENRFGGARGRRWSGIAIAWAIACPIADSAPAAVVVDGSRIVVTSRTMRAEFDGPALVSLRPAGADIEFVHATRPAVSLDAVFCNWNLLGVDKKQTVTVKPLSDRAALVIVEGADSERHLLIGVDEATGDLLLTPSATTNRRALASVRWTIAWHEGVSLVLPCINGLRVDVDRPWPEARRFAWPFEWNAQLAIAERGGYACMVHSEDTARTFKALQLHRPEGRLELSFDVDVPGPIWPQRTAGGITWHVNVYEGDWKAPATRYRDWMARTYDLAGKRAHRPAWVRDITLAVCWARPRIDVLDALATVHPPEQTLIHLSRWRDEKYDVNYPDYTPSAETIAYMKAARERGFHVMPHFNYFACYYEHPFYPKVRDFQIRDARRNEPQGWHWPPDTHEYTRMAYIHPGFSIWRHKLIDVLLAACDRLGTDVAFIDQTLCTWNTDNGLVEGMTTIDGMVRLHEEFDMIRPGLVLVGEGLNEISFQRECFAQAHIHEGWSGIEAKHVESAHPICAFLWDGHTKLIGYFKLAPNDKFFDLAVATYERMGALPTLIVNTPEQVLEPSETTQRVLDAAKGITTRPTEPGQ